MTERKVSRQDPDRIRSRRGADVSQDAKVLPWMPDNGDKIKIGIATRGREGPLVDPDQHPIERAAYRAHSGVSDLAIRALDCGAIAPGMATWFEDVATQYANETAADIRDLIKRAEA